MLKFSAESHARWVSVGPVTKELVTPELGPRGSQHTILSSAGISTTSSAQPKGARIPPKVADLAWITTSVGLWRGGRGVAA